MSVVLLETAVSPASAAATTTNDRPRCSERVSLSAEASSLLGKIPQKPLNLITIWGAARTGKSFFMNTLARTENDVFQVAGGSHPCTVGAFISTTTRSLSEFGSDAADPSLSSSFSETKIGSDEGPAVGFVEVEGQGDKHSSYYIKLVTPLLLLSKVVIFNWRGPPNKGLLDALGMMREASGRIHRSQRQGAFGDLVVLVRDVASEQEMIIQSLLFNLEDDFDGPNINDEEEVQMQLRNEIRLALKASFKSLRVCCLPAPHAEINGDREISQSEVSPVFVAKVNHLRRELAEEALAGPHYFGNEKVVGGKILCSLLTGVCDVVNSELDDLSPLSVMESVQRGHAQSVLAEAKNLFRQSASTSIEGTPSKSKAALKKVLEAATSTAVDCFTQQKPSQAIASEYRKMLDDAIAEGSTAFYAAREQKVSEAKNYIGRLTSESASRVEAKASEIFGKLPIEDEELERSWTSLCSDVHVNLNGDIEKHVDAGILEDLQEEVPTLKELKEKVLGKFNFLMALNKTKLESEENAKALERERKLLQEDAAASQLALQKIKDKTNDKGPVRQKEGAARRTEETQDMVVQVSSAMASTDRDALLALFRWTGGADWRNKTNWGTDAALSSWDGVKVNDEGRVIMLNLHWNNLQGLIPAQLGKLTALEILDLQGNKLSGPIPPELGNLGALQQLVLWGNELSGPIPRELGNLGALQRLVLKGNELSGPIPAQLGKLAALEILDLQRNKLSGPIPPELGNLGALQRLVLWGNELSGLIPAQLGKLAALEILDLQGNKLSGPIPWGLANLGALQQLVLWGNELSGPIPPVLDNLAALAILDLQGNKLSGPIPRELGNLRALQRLVLRGNELSGLIPAQLGKLAALAILDLQGNKLSGPIPRELGALGALQRLVLKGNELSDHIPDQLGKFAALGILDLQGNKLSGRVIATPSAAMLRMRRDMAKMPRKEMEQVGGRATPGEAREEVGGSGTKAQGDRTLYKAEFKATGGTVSPQGSTPHTKHTPRSEKYVVDSAGLQEADLFRLGITVDFPPDCFSDASPHDVEVQALFMDTSADEMASSLALPRGFGFQGPQISISCKAHDRLRQPMTLSFPVVVPAGHEDIVRVFTRRTDRTEASRLVQADQTMFRPLEKEHFDLVPCTAASKDETSAFRPNVLQRLWRWRRGSVVVRVEMRIEHFCTVDVIAAAALTSEEVLIGFVDAQGPSPDETELPQWENRYATPPAMPVTLATTVEGKIFEKEGKAIAAEADNSTDPPSWKQVCEVMKGRDELLAFMFRRDKTFASIQAQYQALRVNAIESYLARMTDEASVNATVKQAYVKSARGRAIQTVVHANRVVAVNIGEFRPHPPDLTTLSFPEAYFLQPLPPDQRNKDFTDSWCILQLPKTGRRQMGQAHVTVPWIPEKDERKVLSPLWVEAVVKSLPAPTLGVVGFITTLVAPLVAWLLQENVGTVGVVWITVAVFVVYCMLALLAAYADSQKRLPLECRTQAIDLLYKSTNA